MGSSLSSSSTSVALPDGHRCSGASPPDYAMAIDFCASHRAPRPLPITQPARIAIGQRARQQQHNPRATCPAGADGRTINFCNAFLSASLSFQVSTSFDAPLDESTRSEIDLKSRAMH